MDQRQAFLQAIIDAPDDDTPRLVFADWLDEHGDPDRAEFIRAQLALEPLEKWSPHRMDLEDRVADLLMAHRAAWLRDLPGWAQTDEDSFYGPTFRRGFVHRAEPKPAEFIEDWEDLFAVAPVEVARLGLKDDGQLLFDCPGLPRLRRLELIYFAESPSLSALLASPHLAGLRGLMLDFYRPIPGTKAMSAAGMRALAQCEALSGLRELNLSGWALNPFRLRELARSRHFSGLRELDLSDTGFDDDMARELAASRHLRNLRMIDLQRNSLGAEGIAALANSPVLRTVTSLVLYNNESIGDDGTAALAASQNLGELRDLCLVSCGLGLRGVRELAASPNLPNLRSLDIQGTRFGKKGAKALLESPYLSRIRSLSLHDCGIRKSMTEALRERFGEALMI
jgi:uncharacterized protein (TIGR02996 family)